MPPVPPAVPTIPDPTIKVIFQGLFVAHLEDQLAQIGAITSGDKCHRPKITIAKLNNGVYVDEVNVARLLGIAENKFDQDLHLDVLDVEGTLQTGIHQFQNQENKFDRRKKEQNDEQDFRWFIDLENDIFKDPEKVLAVDKNQIEPVFRLQKGVFYTAELTEKPVEIKKGDNPAEPFGHVARVIAANIKLDQPHSTAFLKIGEQVLLKVTDADAANGITYEVMFDCDCPPLPESLLAALPPLPSDFVSIFAAVGTNLDDGEKVNLKRDDEGAFNREVICTGGHTGQALR